MVTHHGKDGRVRRRFADESGIRERYERYISKAVIDGIINYTPISFDAIHSVCALPEPRKNTELFDILYTLNEETRDCLKQEWDNLRWNNYYPRCRRCFCPGLCYSCTIPFIYESEQGQWEDRCVIMPYEEATPQLLPMWECILYVYLYNNY